MNSEDELDIRQYLAVLRKRVWLIVAITSVCIVVAGIYSISQPKVYEATSRVVLSPTQDSLNSSGLLSDPNAFQSQVGTQVQVVKSPEVQVAADKLLGNDVTRVRSVSAAGVTNTRILEISAQSKSPEVAQAAANAYTTAYLANRADSAVSDLLSIGNDVQAKEQQLQSQVSQLQGQLGKGNDGSINSQINTLNAQVNSLQQQYTTLQAQATVRQSDAELMSTATVPTAPTSPKPKRNVGVAAVLGLLLGIGTVLLLERLDDRIRTEDDLARQVPNLPQLASIPKVSDWKDESEAKAVTLLEPQSPTAEAYRRLRTSIEFVGLDTELKVIEVTSATAGEGKSTTVANLAAALAWGGKRVVIVAADLRRPRVHDFFGVSNNEGFTSVLLSQEDISTVLQPTQVYKDGSVHVLATGPLPPNPAELLGTQRVKDLFDLLRRFADYVLIDSPPVLPVADPLVLSSYADGIVFVAGADKLRRKQLDNAMALISTAKAPVIGTVLNGTVEGAAYARYEQKYYASHSSPETAEAAAQQPKRSAPGFVHSVLNNAARKNRAAL